MHAGWHESYFGGMEQPGGPNNRNHDRVPPLRLSRYSVSGWRKFGIVFGILMLFNRQESHGQISMTSFIASSHIHHKYIILKSVNSCWHTADFQINTFTHQTWFHFQHRICFQHFRSLPFREYFYRVGGSSGRGSFCLGLHPSLLHLNIPRGVHHHSF